MYYAKVIFLSTPVFLVIGIFYLLQQNSKPMTGLAGVFLSTIGFLLSLYLMKINNLINVRKNNNFTKPFPEQSDISLLDDNPSISIKKNHSIDKDYHALFRESLTGYIKKPCFKVLISILESRYTEDSPFIGEKYQFYFKNGRLHKIVIANGKKLKTVSYDTLEHRYVYFQLN